MSPPMPQPPEPSTFVAPAIVSQHHRAQAGEQPIERTRDPASAAVRVVEPYTSADAGIASMRSPVRGNQAHDTHEHHHPVDRTLQTDKTLPRPGDIPPLEKELRRCLPYMTPSEKVFAAAPIRRESSCSSSNTALSSPEASPPQSAHSHSMDPNDSHSSPQSTQLSSEPRSPHRKADDGTSAEPPRREAPPADPPSLPAQAQPAATSRPDDANTGDLGIRYDYDQRSGHPILRLRPTPSQWQDFPSVLSFARELGAERDGCFKVCLPDTFHDALPNKSERGVPANAYYVKQIKKTTFWQVSTVPSEGDFVTPDPGFEYPGSVEAALKGLKRLFRTNKDRQMRSVRYRVDLPAWTAAQRRRAGVPDRSPIHPLRGDKLDRTRAVIPGIHTPYVYESGAHFGATFQIHAEDFRLASLNHLYRGRKIWVVIPTTAVDVAEKALGRGRACSQFMRHRAEFFFPDKLEKLGVPYRLVDQRARETMVILPDAYHEGFSTGYTLAEAKNYADAGWSAAGSYQACEAGCRLLTAIPPALMRPLAEDEPRLDLCASYGDNGQQQPPQAPFGSSMMTTTTTITQKRAHEDMSQEPPARDGAAPVRDASSHDQGETKKEDEEVAGAGREAKRRIIVAAEGNLDLSKD